MDIEALTRLIGKSVAHVKVIDQHAVSLTLSDGSVLEFRLTGGPGLDSNWHNYAALKVNGREVWQSA